MAVSPGLDFLTTDTGEIITTDTGSPIVVEQATNNDDTELFDFSVDLLRALLWQYNEAENLEGLLAQKAAWYQENQTQFWNDWITNVFDLRTANDFGLSVWSIILNQPIFLNNQPSPPGYPAWGFGSFRRNFTRGNFASDKGGTVQLPTETARLLLRLRYFQLTSAGTVPEINRMLAYLFATFGKAYLIDNLNMSQKYVFLFPLTSQLRLLFNNFDVLPRPAGVESSYYEGTRRFFGFGAPHANFNNGNFGA